MKREMKQKDELIHSQNETVLQRQNLYSMNAKENQGLVTEKIEIMTQLEAKNQENHELRQNHNRQVATLKS